MPGYHHMVEFRCTAGLLGPAVLAPGGQPPAGRKQKKRPLPMAGFATGSLRVAPILAIGERPNTSSDHGLHVSRRYAIFDGPATDGSACEA